MSYSRILGLIALSSLCGRSGTAGAQAANARYANPAPIDQYRSKSQADEIALARSAAPPSISDSAEVLVFGDHGYETAVKGTNGFVCFVERSWADGFEDPEFWNPKLRAPNCFNAAAVRTELPKYLQRTTWMLSGASKDAIRDRTRAAYASHKFTAPEPGAMAFMLSKHGYLNDGVAGPWLPHVMFFVPHGQVAGWGAADGSPIIRLDGGELESTILLIPVRGWSDGSPAPAIAAQHGQAKK